MPLYIYFFLLWRCDLTRAMASSFLRLLDHTQRRTTVGRTPLDEWSARRRDLYLTTHNNHTRQTSMPPVGFETTISAGERPQTYIYIYIYIYVCVCVCVCARARACATLHSQMLNSFIFNCVFSLLILACYVLKFLNSTTFVLRAEY